MNEQGFYKINLLPWRESQKSRNGKRIITIFIAAILFLLSILFFGYAYLTEQVDIQLERNQLLKKHSQELDKKQSLIESISKQHQSISQQLRTLSELEINRYKLIWVLNFLPEIINDVISINTVQIRELNVEIKGSCEDNLLLVEMLNKLKASIFVDDVKMNAVVLEKGLLGEDEHHFSISFALFPRLKGENK